VSMHPTELKVRATGEVVGAYLHDELGLESLFDAEAHWAPARVRLVQKYLERGIRRQDWPQSLHWNWASKAIGLHGILGSVLSAERLMGIECDGKWQGLLLGECTRHRSRISSPPKELVYVDFVESAPWNWKLEPVGQEPLYRGVGPQLLEMATRWSAQLGFKGRLGLHALPQAEGFYRDRCQMTELGPDATYQNLCYFEMAETQAESFLEGVEG
jgi:hypothetical protein